MPKERAERMETTERKGSQDARVRSRSSVWFWEWHGKQEYHHNHNLDEGDAEDQQLGTHFVPGMTTTKEQ